MNYCQFRNQTIKRMCNSVKPLLPPEYQQVEYVQSYNSSSTTADTSYWHINTGVYSFADFEVDAQVTGDTGVKVCGNEQNKCLQRHNAANPYFSCYNSSTSYYITTAPLATRSKIGWIDNKIYVNDVFVTNFNKTTSTNQFTLFGTGAYFYKDIRFYSVKLYDSNGGLIRNFIPCFRINDNKPGMYDVVNDVFYTGTGSSGGLIVGNNV